MVACIGANYMFSIIFSVPVDSQNTTDNGMCLSASETVCCTIGRIMAVSCVALCFVLVLRLWLDVYDRLSLAF